MNLGKLFSVVVFLVSINVFECYGTSLLDHASQKVTWHRNALSDGMMASDALNNLETLGHEIISRDGEIPLNLADYRNSWETLPAKHRNYISAAVLMSKICADSHRETQLDHDFIGTHDRYLRDFFGQYGMSLQDQDMHDMKAYFDGAGAAGWFKSNIPVRSSYTSSSCFDFNKFKVQPNSTILIATTDWHRHEENFERIAQQVRYISHKFPNNKKIVAVNGDFTDANYARGPYNRYEHFSAQIKPLCNLLSALVVDKNTQIVLNMGNHDISGGTVNIILPHLLKLAKEEHIGGRLHFTSCNLRTNSLGSHLERFVQIGNVKIIGYCPPSLLPHHHGREDCVAVKDLQQTLMDISPAEKDSVIVLAHMGLAAAKDVVRYLRPWQGFCTILCGHVHIGRGKASHYRFGDCSLLTLPSGGEGVGIMVIHPDGEKGKMRFWYR